MARDGDTENHCGFDPRTDALVILRVHYRLTIGGTNGTGYGLPIEDAVLESTMPGKPFPVAPDPYQMLVSVLQAVLGHSVTDAIRERLEPVIRRTDRRAVHELLARHLPRIDAAFFDACLRSLTPASSWWTRAVLRRELRRRLGTEVPRSTLLAALGRWRRPWARLTGARLAGGGRVIALIGGDGSGKTTCARELARWLGEACDTVTVNLAWPRRSLLSLVVGGTLRASAVIAGLFLAEPLEASTWKEDERRSRGYLTLLRQVCHARDQQRLALRIHEFAGSGGVALCERYPVGSNGTSQDSCWTGSAPSAARLARLLHDTGESYRDQVVPPDQVIVLRVEPDLAVRRKPAEPADEVRRHARAIWEADWTPMRAHVVDAGRPLPEVLADMKTAIWSEL
jgi:thymidylate kinase